MKTRIIYNIIAVFAIFMLLSCNRDDANDEDGGKGVYHNDDKEALRQFLQQPSAEIYKLNAEFVGLKISDIYHWNDKDNETWVEKIQGLTWNSEIPKRLEKIEFRAMMNPDWILYQEDPPLLLLAGVMDASKWIRLNTLSISSSQITSINISSNTELTHLHLFNSHVREINVSANTALANLYLEGSPINEINISANKALERLRCRLLQLTALDVSRNTALTVLDCTGNQLTELDVSRNSSLESLNVVGNQLTVLDISKNSLLESLYCVDNHLTEIDITANTILRSLHCGNNHLSLAELFSISDKWKYIYDSPPHLSIQSMPPQTVNVGSEIDYSDQLIFKDIETVFTITKDDLPVSESDYTLLDGKLTFNSTGLYVVTMTNNAINSYKTYDAKTYTEITVQ